MKTCINRIKLHITENSPGFTMIELLIAFLIFAMIAVVVTPLFREGNYFWQATQSQVELRQNLNSALEFISTELRKADPDPESIVIETDPGVISYTSEGVAYQVYISGSETGIPYRHIVFNDGNTTALTSPTRINIVSAGVYNASPGYEIWLTGEYKGPNNLNSEQLQVTVHSNVVPRRQN